MLRHLRLLGVQLRLSAVIAMQYRWEFLLDGFFSVFWTITALLPLWLVFEERPLIAGYTYPEALTVVGFFTLLQGVLEGAIHPSLATVIEAIRTGTLDFVLLKPADAQFLVSTQRFSPWRGLNALAGIGVLVYAFAVMGRAPSPGDVALAALMLVLAIGVLYSMWILVISAAFHVGRIDNLRYLFLAVFDAARWPSTVYRGVLSMVFTFVIPLALMTTYPAGALLGRLPWGTVGTAWIGGLVFAGLARAVWLRSIRRYTSASS
ncbi:MAG: ABC-2 family transporter protein [Myxococcota bacterium]|nr:ABC-2 family transporter protein [Myxococcota bacterium]